MTDADVFSEYFPVQSTEINGVPRFEIVDALLDRRFHNKAIDFEECHTRVIPYVCNGCGYTHFLPKRCDLRICPDCGKANHSGYVMRLVEKMKELGDAAPEQYRFRLITLTTPKLSVDEWDHHAYDFIMKSVSNFMKHKLIKPRFNGGFGGALRCIETKYSEEGGVYFKKRSSQEEYEYRETGVHVHAHMIGLSKFVDQKKKHGKSEATKAWRDATGGKAYIVDIRAVDNMYSALSEATKYLFKPSHLGPADNYARLIEYTQGRRLEERYGCFRKLDLKREKRALSCAVCDESLSKGEEVERKTAVVMFDSQRVSKNSLLAHIDNRKPVLPEFKDKNS